MVTLSIGYSMAPAALWPCVPKIIPLKCLGTAYSMIFLMIPTLMPMMRARPYYPCPFRRG
ncbi:MAG: hypothetical protein J6X07_11105 [Prevotella sp.]|nr:hypothetical protein [Prevotella sp.]MBP5715231.1 hypothetical protein [Prevotella sp.]